MPALEEEDFRLKGFHGHSVAPFSSILYNIVHQAQKGEIMDFSSFDKIIEFAIAREEDAIQAYGEMSGRAKVPGLKNLLLELQSEEKNHKKLLEGINKNELMNLEIKDVLDLKISDYLVEEPLSENVTFQDLLIFAAKKEQKAVELYTVMRDRLDQPEFIKLFDYLIEQEKNHKLKLETEYDDSVYQED